MSEKYYRIVKRYYDEGEYTKEDVRAFVPRKLTEEEYELITGEPYIKDDN